MESEHRHLVANVERFGRSAEHYDRYRPEPPKVIVDIVTQWARIERPRLVVDIGSGTGLSTMIWADRAEEVVGIEPGADMRRQAELRTKQNPNAINVRYQDGFSTRTDLPDACADVVTCSQSLHWMEPEPTFAEIARILRPGGIFSAYDFDWPPTLHCEAETAFRSLMDRAGAIEKERGLGNGIRMWAKEQHLGRMQACGHFKGVKEILAHHIEKGNAERWVGMITGHGSILSLINQGFNEEELGLGALPALAQRTIGDQPIPWYFSYRIRVGVKKTQ